MAAIESDVLGTVAQHRDDRRRHRPTQTPGNNTSTTTLEVSSESADLGVSKQGEPNPVVAGGQVTYTVTVSNDGPSTARDVTITDTLPAGFAYVAGSASPSQGTCEEPSGGVLGCDLRRRGRMASTATVTFTMDGSLRLHRLGQQHGDG